jgi:hypothetical protein
MIYRVKYTLQFIFVASAAVFAIGCSDAKQRSESSENLKHLTRAVLKYHSDNEEWPDGLADVKSVVGQSDDLGEIGGGKAYAALATNPLTNANPGYEYVKPADQPESYGDTVVLYQLRDGKRDEALPAGYLDGSVR